MTTVMRAMSAPDAARVLRLAVVEAGKVVDERLFSTDVTVGATEAATFLVPWRRGRRPFRLFHASREGFVLQLSEGIKGTLAQSGQVHRLEDVAVDRSGRAKVRLKNDARGKVILGEVTLLFQLVAAPPKHLRPQLPVAVIKPISGDVDWLTTVVAAFSFLLHFFAVALVYSDWLDPVIDETYVLGQLLEATTVLPAPPPLDQQRSERPASSAETSARGEAAAAKPAMGRPGKPRAGSGNAAEQPSDSPGADSRAADIVSELAQLEVQTLTALNDAGPATATLLDSSEVPAGLLDDVAQSEAGARRADARGLLGLDGRGSDAVRPGEQGEHDLASVGNRRGSRGRDAATTAGSARAVDGPTGEAAISATGQTGGVIPNAAGVVARMRGPFRACYQRGLDGNPEMQGSVNLMAKVGANGEVLSVSGTGGGLGPIMGCLKGVVQSAAFAPPEGGMGFVSISVHFRQIGR